MLLLLHNHRIINGHHCLMHHLKSLSEVLIIALAMPLSAQAAEWSAEPRISLKTGYNDNIRLTTLDHDAV